MGALALGFQASAVEGSAADSDISPWVAPPIPQSMTRLGLEVAFVNKDGQPLNQTSLRGVSTVALAPGEKHGVRLVNHNPTRVSLVIAIDGLNPSTGKPSYMGQPGLVLNPGETVTLYRTRLKRKGDLVPLFEGRQEGSINVGIFQERTDYPFITPGMSPPPYGPENFVQDGTGRRWVPPQHYPFRKTTDLPASMIYLRYARTQ